MTCLSTLTFILQTLPSFQAEEDAPEDEKSMALRTIDFLDTTAMVFFTLEYLIRLFCSPRTWVFFKRPMNLVDLLAILPFYLSLALENLDDVDIIGKAGKQVQKKINM